MIVSKYIYNPLFITLSAASIFLSASQAQAMENDEDDFFKKVPSKLENVRFDTGNVPLERLPQRDPEDGTYKLLRHGGMENHDSGNGPSGKKR